MGKPQSSVMETGLWIKATACRYVRLCERRSRTLSVSNERLAETVIHSLPNRIAAEMERQGYPHDSTEVLRLAHKIEDGLRAAGKYRYEPLGAMAAETTNPDGRAYSQAKSPSVPHNPCRGCGAKHWYRECPHKKGRCSKCQRTGHLPEFCTNTVQYGANGMSCHEVETEPAPSLCAYDEIGPLPTNWRRPKAF